MRKLLDTNGYLDRCENLPGSSFENSPIISKTKKSMSEKAKKIPGLFKPKAGSIGGKPDLNNGLKYFSLPIIYLHILYGMIFIILEI